MDTERKHLFTWLLAAVCLASFILRLTAGLQLLASDPFVSAPPSTTDMATYKTISEAILKGNFPKEFYYQPFYYAVFLPAVQFFSGPSDFAVVLAQTLCGTLAVLFAGLAAARIAGKKAGIAAAVLLTFSHIAILYTPYRLIEISQLLWFTLLLFLTLDSMRKGGMLRWFLTGLILSFAILSRGNAWCFLPAVLLAFHYGECRFRKSGKKTVLLSLSLLFAGIILPQIPFAAVNSIHYGRLRGPSTAGSAVLALGNTKEAPPGGLEYPLSYEIWTKNEAVRSVPMRILDWFLEEPLAYLELTFRKCFLFWNCYDIPNNINPAVMSKRSPLLSFFPLIPTGFLLVLCLTAVLMSLKRVRRHRALAVFLLFLCFYWLAAAAFYNLGRFRIPAFGFFCIASGLCIAELIRSFRKKEYRKLVLYHGIALIASIFVVYPGYDLYRENLESSLIRIARPSGVQVPVPGQGRMVTDHGPRSFGGWNLVKGNYFRKTFAAKTAPGTIVPLSIALCRIADDPIPVLRINGQQFVLSDMKTGALAYPTLKIPYPEDGIFHIEVYGALALAADLQREYGRTMTGEGTPLPYELLMKVQMPE